MASKTKLICISGALAGIALGAWLLRPNPNGRTTPHEESNDDRSEPRPDPLQSARIWEQAEI